MLNGVVVITLIVISVILAVIIGGIINKILYGNRLFVNNTKVAAVYFLTFMISLLVLYYFIGTPLGLIRYRNSEEDIEITTTEKYTDETIESTDISEETENYNLGLEETDITDNSTDANEDNNTKNNDWIFPESDTRYLTQEDVDGIDMDQVRYGLNEIYARHGRTFNNQELQEYFDSKVWYSPLYTPDEFSQIESSTFNEYEKENIKFLSEFIS